MCVGSSDVFYTSFRVCVVIFILGSRSEWANILATATFSGKKPYEICRLGYEHFDDVFEYDRSATI